MIQNTAASPPLTGFRKTKGFGLVEWASRSHDLSQTEMLWHDPKKAVHALKPSDAAELQQFCMDKWAKISPQCCKRFIASCHNFETAFCVYLG